MVRFICVALLLFLSFSDYFILGAQLPITDDYQFTTTTDYPSTQTTEDVVNEVELSPGNNSISLDVCNRIDLHVNTTGLKLFGNITVLIKLSNPVKSTLRQAYLLNKLNERFKLAGYKRINFVIIAPDNNMLYTLQLYATDLKIIVAPPRTGVGGLENRTDEMIFFDQLNVGSAYVFDSCARLTFTIYYPWSSVHRPYVKAAILSTVYDEPCGECENQIHVSQPSASRLTLSSDSPPIALSIKDESVTRVSNNETINSSPQPLTASDRIVESTISPINNRIDSVPTTESISQEESTSDDVSGYVIPIRIIIPVDHIHPIRVDDMEMNGTTMNGNDLQTELSVNETNKPIKKYLKYTYIVLKTNSIQYHEHLLNDQPDTLTGLQSSNADNYPDSNENSDTNSVPKPEAILTSSDTGRQFHRTNRQRITDENGNDILEFDEVAPISNAISFITELSTTTEESTSRDYGRYRRVEESSTRRTDAYPVGNNAIDEHYGKIIPWIHFSLNFNKSIE